MFGIQRLKLYVLTEVFSVCSPQFAPPFPLRPLLRRRRRVRNGKIIPIIDQSWSWIHRRVYLIFRFFRNSLHDRHWPTASRVSMFRTAYRRRRRQNWPSWPSWQAWFLNGEIGSLSSSFPYIVSRLTCHECDKYNENDDHQRSEAERNDSERIELPSRNDDPSVGSHLGERDLSVLKCMFSRREVIIMRILLDASSEEKQSEIW